MSHAAITIDSIRTTQSTCANNGTISVYTHGGTTILYALIAGPNLRPQQSSIQFSSLPPGTYLVLITDFSNDSLTATATVSGNYTSPSFVPTHLNPVCPASSTGTIIGNPQNDGTAPYTWKLTNLGTSASTSQLSDTFYNLISGTYRLQETDSCGNFSTYSITLFAVDDSFSIGSITNYIIPCDSVRLGIGLIVPNSHYSPPYTIQIQTHNGTYQHTITNMTYTTVNPVIYETVPGVGYGDYINVTITDGCGKTAYIANTVAAFYVKYNFNAVSDSCQLKYIGYLYVPGDSAQSNVNTTFMPDPVMVIISNSSGILLDTVFNVDTINHSSQYAYTNVEIGNQNYNIKMIDGCGNVYTRTIAWPITPPPIISTSIIPTSCMDSTAGIEIVWQNTFFSRPTFELLSGPSFIESTKPHYVYRDTITYPQFFATNGTQNGYFIELTNLAVGTYHYRVYDSCGNSLIDSFVITRQDLNIDNFTITPMLGCPGQNKIAISNDHYSIDYLVSGPGAPIGTLISPADTLQNLNSGTYVFSFLYSPSTYALPVNHNVPCQFFYDTVVVPVRLPPQISYTTQIECHGTMYVAFQPDSTTGVPPYKYEILSGPQTTGVQYSNSFTLSQPGTYLARVSDSCGFASTYAFTVDTLAFAQIVKVGSSCLGYGVTLNCQHSPYATYIWHEPNGTSYTGDSLVINPIVAGDFGTYTISKIVNVNGCKDTFSNTYNFVGDTVTQIYAAICPGQNVLFAGINRSVAGIYYDTIPRTGSCDSIVALTVSIKGPVYDSVFQTICPGLSISVGIHSYSTTGIYRDTFVTAGCDSIHILNLVLNSYRRDTLSEVICPGQTILFGGVPHMLSGTYYDTIPTSGCDSIVTLNLSIRGPLYDSISETICAGQNVIVGPHTYSASGIYRDTFPTSGCDSVHVLDLHVIPYSAGALSMTICPGQSFSFGGISHYQAGLYYDTIPTAGCDSIVTLALSIRGPLYDSVPQTICAGQSVTIGTHTYNASGIYRDTFLTAGCDSVHVLDLNVTPYGRGTDTVVICPGQTYLFGSRTLSQPGTYYDTLTTTGCDSIVTLNLSIRTPLYDSVVQNICIGQSVAVGIHHYSSSGIYYDTIPTVVCDSIHVLNLQVTPYSHGAISVVICPGQNFIFGGNTISQAGSYYDTLSTTGCDSIVALTLSIRGPLYDSVSQTICAGQSVQIATHSYTSTGVYYDTIATSGCNSLHVLNLQVIPYSAGIASAIVCPGQTFAFGGNILTQPGIYRDTLPTNGCDSIVTLTLAVRGPLYDSVSQTICAGQSATSGIHSYTVSGIYHDTIATGGCDSVHVLNLTVTPSSAGAISEVLCPGQAFLFGGLSLSQPGIYYDTLTTTSCDSIVALTLTIRGPLYDSVVQSICTGQSISAGVHTYSASGIYYDTIETNGCDSVHVLNLQVSPYKTGAISYVICPGQNFIFGSNTISQSGIYYDTLSTTGCDSIVALTLSIRGPLYDSTSQTICAGQSVQIGTHIYTASGIYYDTIPTGSCDSIHVLNLNITPYSRSSFSAMICPAQNFLFANKTISVPGTYYDTIPVPGRCDSIVTLDLTVRGGLYDSVSQIICSGQSVSVGQHTYSSTGLYRDTIATAGCDSMHVLDLLVLPYIYSSNIVSICAGQQFLIGVHSYAVSGIYIDTISGISGCDSIITTDLTVISPTNLSLDTSGICTLTYGGQIFSTDATLYDTIISLTGCDSIYRSIAIHIAPPTDSIVYQSACIYSGQSYVIGGQSHSGAGTYSDTLHTAMGNCDSLIIQTNLSIISPMHSDQHVDSCYSAIVGGIKYTSDTVLRDTVLSACGLDSIISVDSIHLYDPTVILITSSQLPIIIGESVQLSISPSGNYQNIVWSPNYDISSIYSADPTVSPKQDTTYTVTAETAEHCVVSAQILVSIVGTDQPDFLMPTAFSPNGDGNNDIYRPVIKNGPLDVISFQIYDRWGSRVYDKEIDGGEGWNGTYKNVKQPLSVYIYYITAKISTGKIVKQSGNLTLLR